MADPVAASSSTPSRLGRVVRLVLGVELLLLLGLAQVLFAGYRLGVGNQSIQIPFLRHWVDPGLFANDPMVKRTLADYPSLFYRGLAVLVARVDLYSAYFWLHVATAAATLGSAYALGRAMFKDRSAGVVLVLLLFAGHHRALAGDDLYSLGFTHTWAVFPLAIGAMALFYADRHLLAFALVGVVFNLHALTAAYLFAMFAAWGAWELRRPRGWWWRFGLCVGVFALLASPTILDMLRHRQPFGAEWLERTRIRSADHSFPSTWWAAGASDVPRFALLVGLAAVSMSFVTDPRVRRKSLAVAVAAGGMFAVGWVFADVWPVATVVRAQLFRSSRLVIVLMLAHAAWGIVCGWRLSGVSALWQRKAARAAWRGSSDVPFPQGEGVRREPQAGVAGRVLEVGLATAVFACLAVPGLIAVAPWVLLAAAGVALFNARLSRAQAVVAGVALLVTVVAWRSIEFHVPGIDGVVSLAGARQAWADAGRALWIAAALAAAVWAVMRVRVGWRAKLCAGVAAGFVCVAVAVPVYRKLARAGLAEPWVAAQRWAAANTPRGALFITPPQQGGFRIHSGRSVVCEWRDGTQLYFTAGFAREWWDMLTALRPSAALDGVGGGGGAGSSELLKSKSLEGMSDPEIVRLAERFGATHVVLPAGQTRELLEKFTAADGSGRGWTVYEPRIVSAEEAFVENVVRPNIERYRKGDARLELYDPQGRRVADGSFEVRQTRQAFGFGVSIPPFGALAGTAPEWVAPPVTARQLDAVKGVFNFSVIPFSAKWNALEPEQGKRVYAELDRYVDWCVKHGIEMEFHYLSGFTPPWAARLPQEKQKAAWIAYCLATVERYHDRIKYWQVTNGRRLGHWSADAIRAIRAKYPGVKLGTSDCQSFYEGGGIMGAIPGPRTGMEEIRQLDGAGVRPDFFSTHGHKPNGVWPDMRTVYKYLDEFAALGVKVHVSEATVSQGLAVIGRPEQEGNRWTAEMQASFLETYYTTLFSHPAVEAVNYWDLSASVSRGVRGAGGATGLAGLLDPANGDAPRLAYVRLKELIQKRWMTRESGRVGGDGTVAFRGFHGAYEVGVKTADGRSLVGRFEVKPGEANRVRVQLSEEAAGKVASGE